MRPKSSSYLLAGLMVAVGVFSGAAKPQATIERQLAFGVTMAKRGLWNEALFRFRMANQVQPNDGRILNNMAVAFEAVGQFEAALVSYQKALKADPTNRELKRNYSRFIEFYQGFRPPKDSDEKKSAESTVADTQNGQ